MGIFSLGFMIEFLVAILLVVTIGYCLIVNRKLDSLRSDKSELRAIIRDLYAATGHAEQAIGTFRKNAESLEVHLGEQVARAQNTGTRLARDIERAEGLVSKLAVISQTAPARAVRNKAEKPRRPVNRDEADEPVMVPERSKTSRHARVGLGLLNARKSGDTPDAADVKEVA